MKKTNLELTVTENGYILECIHTGEKFVFIAITSMAHWMSKNLKNLEDVHETHRNDSA